MMIYPKERPQLTRIRSIKQQMVQMRWVRLHRSLAEEVQLPQRTKREERCRSMSLGNLQNLATRIRKINNRRLMRLERLERVLIKRVARKLLTRPKVSRVDLNSISLQRNNKITSILLRCIK